MIELVIFDIDGTIVDAYGAIQQSLNYARAMFRYRDVGIRTVKMTIGHGDKSFIELFFRPEHSAKALEIFRKHHAKALLVSSRAMPCARRVLAAMRRNGVKLAVVSNRPEKYSLILLKKLGLWKYFDMIECAGKESEFKPRPTLLQKALRDLGVRPEQALYVGDMAIDVQAGRNASIKTIAVIGGSSTAAALKKEKPYRLIRTLCELPDIIKNISLDFQSGL